MNCPFISRIPIGIVRSYAPFIMKFAVKCPFIRRMSSAVIPPSEPTNKSLNCVDCKCRDAGGEFNNFTELNCPYLRKSIDQSDCEELDAAQCPYLNSVSVRQKQIKGKEEIIEVKTIPRQREESPNKLMRMDRQLSFDYKNLFEKKINEKKNDDSYRVFRQIDKRTDSFPSVSHHSTNKNNNQVVVWCSNDYLGLGTHPFVREKSIKAIEDIGTSSGGTRNISGTLPLHVELERSLANLHEKESALLFTSCYVANDTTLYTLGKLLPNCQIYSDSGNHASMIQGIRTSGTEKFIFRHNDPQHLDELLKKNGKDGRPKIVAFESVHSMDGSICPIEQMCDVAHRHGAITFVDEVHAVGLYGKSGGGISQLYDIQQHCDIITGTMGKAFGNVGGYITGNSLLIDVIRSYASGFIFTTSLPPSVLAGGIAAIKISGGAEGRLLRERHQKNVAYLKQRLCVDYGLPVIPSISHIIPVHVGHPKICTDICNRLYHKHQIYVQPINYPTVAKGEERLRLVPTPLHSKEMMNDLCDALSECWSNVTSEKKEISQFKQSVIMTN
ncbi:hypothetical protein SNEBB_002652 [Seison nebaliae]|nr:hypothetical protein SNEBB_002652 [Seison nebaliae]